MRMGIVSILVEGGAAVHTSFVRHELWDKLTVYVAPMLLGSGRAALGNLSIARIADAVGIQRARWQTIHGQIALSGYRNIEATFGMLASAVADTTGATHADTTGATHADTLPPREE